MNKNLNFQRYKKNFHLKNPGLLAKLLLEMVIQMDCPDYFANELQKELLEGRIIEKLKVEDLKKTIKNVKIARSPRLRDG